MKISEITHFFNSKVPKVQIINKNKKNNFAFVDHCAQIKGKKSKAGWRLWLKVNSLIKSDFVLGSLAEIK